ncbi:MAG: energy transducer TonB [Cyclobacteriaceae bacterium]|nr:energy transducer TonB [Cyclobacteriaceae bacterium HetDA_MAG_MS6]
MQLKKDRTEKNKKLSTLFFFIGLTVSLLIVTTAINWKSYDNGGIVDLGQLDNTFDDVMEVPISTQPPPPPPKINQPVFVEVPNGEIVQEIEIELDMEMTEETVIEDVIVDFAVEQPEEERVDEIFQIVETWPQPEGGMQTFYDYVARNMVYPRTAARLSVSGMVFVKFVVEKDGSLTDITVVKGIGAGCDEEAVRVLSGSPKWQPGKQRGRNVRVWMTVPIRFVLKN